MTLYKHMLSPSSLLKITRVLARNGGENGTIIIVVSAVCRSWTWHLSAFVSGWGYHISSFTCLHGFGWSCLTSHLLIASSLWPLIYRCQYCQIHCHAADMFKRSWPLHNNNLPLLSHIILIHNILPLSHVNDVYYGPPSIKVTSCRLQLIIQEVDLETPFWCLGACMPQWQVLRVWREVFIIGLRSNDSTGVRRQLTDSHAIDCAYSTLRTIVIIGGTSRVC